jgi:NAD(P)-dependent dehydrogenase (short-subunit alcohol dehydrogenase family)
MLTGKVIIVAGGGNGIGKATAIELADAGATVVVNDLGVTLSGEREEYGRVDGAVNFAGIVRDSISYEMTGEEFDSVIEVHLRGHFALLGNLGAHWRERAAEREDGRLETQRSFLAVSSTAATEGNVGQVNYAAAKGGILGMVRTAAKELHRLNVRVNALLPAAYTRMIESIPDEDFKREFRENKPPEKVAPMVGYVMSDAAEDVTGCSILAEGDAIGLVSDPETTRIAFRDGGWTIEAIADRFRSTVGKDEELTRT